jgi:cation transport ATPase
MKNSFLVLLVAAATNASAQHQKIDTVFIKTSAQCGDCKDRIESTLNYQKGVKYAELNLETKVVMCVFKPKKNNVNSLRVALSKVGYDADEVKAIPSAVLQLPKCCQPGGH